MALAPPEGFFDDGAEASVPPQNLRAEAEILGNLMYPGAGDRMPELVGSLRVEHFASRAYGEVYKACLALHADGLQPTIAAVADRMRRSGVLRMLEGQEMSLADMVTSSQVLIQPLLAQHVGIVVGHWRSRQALVIGQKLVAVTLAGQEPDIAGALEELGQLQRSESSGVAIIDGPGLAKPLPELEYLLREIGMPAGGSAPDLVAGYGYSGKTLALQSMALSLAAGVKVWGAYDVRDPRRVVHVDLEQGGRLTTRRYQRLARAMGVDLASLGHALAVAIMPAGLTLTGACRDRWRSILEGRDLAIVDSLRAATGGQDENSSDIRAGLDMLGSLSNETGCRVVVIHHARKPTEDGAGGRYAIRGSGAIYEGVDGAYIFGANKGEPVSVEHVKARSHGELVDDFALVISDVELDGNPKAGLSVSVRGGELITELRRDAKAATKTQARKAEHVTAAARVAEYLAAHPGGGTRDIRSALRRAMGACPAELAIDAVALLVEAGAIVAPDVGRGQARPHWLVGPKVPTDVLAHVSLERRPVVSSAAPPPQEAQ
jgi:hypothetical protein